MIKAVVIDEMAVNEFHGTASRADPQPLIAEMREPMWRQSYRLTPLLAPVSSVAPWIKAKILIKERDKKARKKANS